MNKMRAAIMAAIVTASIFFGLKCKAAISITPESGRIYKLDTVVGYDMVDSLVEFIVDANLESETKPIILILDSPGGSVLAGAKILDYINASKAPIHCVVDNFAASMAAMILENCDKRFATPSAVIMFHNASGEFSGEFPQVKSRFEAFERLVSSMELVVAKRVKMDIATYRNKIAAEWWIMGSKEAIALGVVDGEASIDVTPSSMQQKKGFLDFLFGGKYTSYEKDIGNRPFGLKPFIDKLLLDLNEKREEENLFNK